MGPMSRNSTPPEFRAQVNEATTMYNNEFSEQFKRSNPFKAFKTMQTKMGDPAVSKSEKQDLIRKSMEELGGYIQLKGLLQMADSAWKQLPPGYADRYSGTVPKQLPSTMPFVSIPELSIDAKLRMVKLMGDTIRAHLGDCNSDSGCAIMGGKRRTKSKRKTRKSRKTRRRQ